MGTNKNNSKNNGNGFEKIQFVIPIRERFGFGVSIKPVNNHNSFFRTDTSTIDFQGKPITANKEFRSGGGIMAGSVGLALPLNKKMGLGLSIDRLFGSSRDEHSMVLNSISYRLFNIRTYNGSTFNLDFAGQFF